jgi:hypothetical protein
MPQRFWVTALSLFALVLSACAGDSVTGAPMRPGQGLLAVRLTDAPLPLDSVAEVNVYVVRIDARRAPPGWGHLQDDIEHDDDSEDENGADSTEMSDDCDEREHVDSARWVTIAEPDTTFNFLLLRDGVTALLGTTPIDTGHFRAVRLVIDPARSSIVLKDGTVYTATSSPGVEFRTKSRHALVVELDDEVEIEEGETTVLTIDLKLDQSLTLRGKSLHDGFRFQPTVAGWTNRRHD